MFTYLQTALFQLSALPMDGHLVVTGTVGVQAELSVQVGY